MYNPPRRESKSKAGGDAAPGRSQKPSFSITSCTWDGNCEVDLDLQATRIRVGCYGLDQDNDRSFDKTERFEVEAREGTKVNHIEKQDKTSCMTDYNHCPGHGLESECEIMRDSLKFGLEVEKILPCTGVRVFFDHIEDEFEMQQAFRDTLDGLLGVKPKHGPVECVCHTKESGV